jgi:hypothetical protein
MRVGMVGTRVPRGRYHIMVGLISIAILESSVRIGSHSRVSRQLLYQLAQRHFQ